ncbi:MAG: dynamin family protein [Planctomycetia bacterium]|nr:dynamin family protein [Planctomycetia bacterium]
MSKSNPYTELEKRFNSVQQGMQSLLKIAQESDQSEIARRLQVAYDCSRERVFRVAIAGEFSTGKSTLINALLGKALLPTALEACTAVVTRIRKAEKDEEPGVLVTFAKSGTRRVSEEALRSSLTFQGQAGDDFPVEAEVLLPAGTFLDHGIEIVDTPGVNDPEARGEQVTLGFLPKADAIIFVTHAARAFKESEIDFLRDRVGDQDRGRVLFVVNACDLIEEDEDREDLRKRAHQLLHEKYGRFQTHLLSARDGLAAREKNDSKGWDLSGLFALSEQLNQLLVRERGEGELRKAQTLAINFRSEMQRKIEDSVADLGLDEEIRSRRASRVQEAIQYLENSEKEAQVLVHERFQQLSQTVRSQIDSETSSLGGELEALGETAKEGQDKNIEALAQNRVSNTGKKVLTSVQSKMRTEVDRIQKSVASQMTQSIGAAVGKLESSNHALVPVANVGFNDLVIVNTDRSVKEREVEQEVRRKKRAGSPEARGWAGAGIGALIGLALLGPWGLIPGMMAGGGLAGSMEDEDDTFGKTFRTVRDYFVTKSVESRQAVSGLVDRLWKSTDPAIREMAQRTSTDVEQVYATEIGKLRHRLADLQEPTREAAEQELQKQRAEALLKKLRNVPLSKDSD